MKTIMKPEELRTLEDAQAFLEGTQAVVTDSPEVKQGKFIAIDQQTTIFLVFVIVD